MTNKSNFTKKSRITMLSLYITYFIVFQIIYQKWIVTIYAYQGFVNDFNSYKFILSLAILVSLYLATKNNNRASTIFINIAITIILIPSLVLYSGMPTDSDFIYLTVLAFSIIISTVRFFKFRRISCFCISDNKLIYASIVISSITIVAMVLFGNLRFINFNFANVYSIRREAADALPGAFAYINSIVTKVFIPVGTALSVSKRKYFTTALLFFMSIMFFGLTAHKAPLLYPLIVIFFFFVASYHGLKKIMVVVALFIVVISGIDLYLFERYQTSGFGWVGALFVNRALLVPSALNAIFIEHFSSVEKYFWSSSKISLGLISNPHDLNAPNLIGYIYYGNSDMSANTGWIGSGFANAGYLGVILYSIIIGLLFSFLDVYSNKLGARLVISLFIVPVLTILTSADITDMLITHGLIFSLLTLILMDSNCNDVSTAKPACG